MQHIPVSQIQTGLKIQFSIFIFDFNKRSRKGSAALSTYTNQIAQATHLYVIHMHQRAR